jgi:hypothetical protein
MKYIQLRELKTSTVRITNCKTAGNLVSLETFLGACENFKIFIIISQLFTDDHKVCSSFPSMT